VTDHTLTHRLGPGSTVLQVTAADGNRVAAESLGDGQLTVVVLPGGGQDRSRWGAVATSLAGRGMRVVVVDLRGHGDSDRSSTGSYELEDYAGDVRAVLHRIDTPVTLIGHSMGGRVALLMSPDDPRVGRLVLIDSSPDMRPDGPTNRFLRDTSSGFDSVEEACERMEAHHERSMDRGSIVDELRQGDDERFYWHWDPAILDRVIAEGTAETDRLCLAATRLRIPTMLVRTEFSQFVDDDAEERLRSLVPQLQVVSLPGTHHHRPWARADELAMLLQRFVRPGGNTSVDNPSHAG
jgi:pimeloyl-ACP methyl ester carboxylesterase